MNRDGWDQIDRRGKTQAQPEFLTTIILNQRVPAGHPRRGIKTRADEVLARLSPLFEALHADAGRPSIPPEQLLKGRILMALYSVRSERLFCAQLAYNLLWLWFLDRELDEGGFDPTVFTQNYERVLSADVAKLFFAENRAWANFSPVPPSNPPQHSINYEMAHTFCPDIGNRRLRRG